MARCGLKPSWEGELTDERNSLLAWIEGERNEILQFYQSFIRERGPNPPGDTRSSVAFIRRFLDAGEGWTKDPWGGEIVGGRIYGRGASDMKAGTTASIMTYALLARLRDHLP